jgi:clan AA aspartic protease
MHYGTVNYVHDDDEDVLEASVTLVLIGDDGATENIDFVIDTGLTEEVALPQDLINRLNLTSVDDDGDIELTMADGTTAAVKVYLAHIMWHEQSRRVAVVNLEGVPLIGMQLLRGSNLNVDAVPHGIVTITELADAP